MKLATLNDGSRDGRLLVVSRDGTRYVEAEGVKTLQGALDEWHIHEPKLRALFDHLNKEPDWPRSCPIQVKKLRSPLPRAYEWIDGSAYINHIVLVRKARGANPPETLRTEPLLYQGGSGTFLDPTQDIAHKSEQFGIDFEAEVAVITGDVPMGTSAGEIERQGLVKLVLLANDVTLRNLIPDELAKGFGFFISKPSTAFSPFAVTPDELDAVSGEGTWKAGRVHLPLITRYNGELFGCPEAGPEMHFSFYDLIEFAVKTRSLTAGTIVGSGTVSNESRSKGSSCIAEMRMIEKIDTGEFKTPYMSFGDNIEIEMLDRKGVNSIFGKISQRVVVAKCSPPQ